MCYMKQVFMENVGSPAGLWGWLSHRLCPA